MKNFIRVAQERLRGKEDEGFTLIELIIVIAVIGILVAIAIPVYGNIQENARNNAADSSAKSGVNVALASHHRGMSEEEITAQVKKADNEDITHTVAFEDERIEVTASFGDPSSSKFASATRSGSFAAGSEEAGPPAVVYCPLEDPVSRWPKAAHHELNASGQTYWYMHPQYAGGQGWTKVPAGWRMNITEDRVCNPANGDRFVAIWSTYAEGGSAWD